jgi:hypothetical protein
MLCRKNILKIKAEQKFRITTLLWSLLSTVTTKISPIQWALLLENPVSFADMIKVLLRRRVQWNVVYLWRILLSMVGGAAEYSTVSIYMEHESYMLNCWQAAKFQLVTKILPVLTTLSFNISYQGVYSETIYLEGVWETRNAFKISARNYGGKKHLEDLEVNYKIILILLLKLKYGDSWIRTAKYLLVVGSISAQ